MTRDKDQGVVRSRLVQAGLLGCVIVIAVGFAARPVLQTGALYQWKAVVWFAAVIAIALSFVRDHPFPRLGPANQITLVRAMLVALAAGLIGEPHTSAIAAAAVFAASMSAVLDGVDGSIARRSGTASPFGGRFDVETDSILILALSVLVWRHEKAGVWVLASGLMRYAFVASGWLLPWMAGPLTPTLRGRVVAVAQVVGLGLVLLPAVLQPTSAFVAGATVIALTWSFAVDVSRLWRGRGASPNGPPTT